MKVILAQPCGFCRHEDLAVGAENRSNSNRRRKDVINTLRRPDGVEASTFSGREEHIERRLPYEPVPA